MTDESDTTNNCSSSVSVVVSGATDGPDLEVYALTITSNPGGVFPGSSIGLSAGVRNAGDESSAATTVRYYRSTDSTITTSDTEEGSDELSALDPEETISIGETLTVPADAGTYYYGACVDSVTDESDTTNNCSSSVSVVVSESQGSRIPRASSPAQVTGVVVTPSIGELTVAWKAVSDADGYQVQWKSGEENYDESRQVEIAGGKAVNYTITELQPGIEHAVRVIATKENADEGTPSHEVTGIPKASSPTQVTSVVVTPSIGGLAVAWKAVPDADGYQVQWKSGEESYSESRQVEIAGGETVNYTITELQPGIEHAVRVIADLAEDGTPSHEVTGIPKASSPTQVTGVVVTPSIGELAVAWKAVPDADGYQVQWKSGEESYSESRQVEIAGGETVNYTITELLPGTEYTVRVIADHAEDGTPSHEVTGIPKASSPAQVTGVLVEAGAEALEVSWMAVSDADGYQVQWKSGEESYSESRQVEIAGGKAVNYTITELQPGIEHAVRVIATKENADEGTPSHEVTGIPKASSPTQVTSVVVTPSIGGLAVAWKAVPDADGYQVQWKSGEESYSESRQVEIAGGETVNYTITELQPGIEHAVRVIADLAEDGTPSHEVTGIPKASSPTQVTGVVVTPSIGELAVAWKAVPDADGYQVQWKSGEESYSESRQVEIAGGETVNYTITELLPGTEYTVRVIADHAEDGTPSHEVTGIPKASSPAQVTGVLVEAGAEALEVSWMAVSDAGGYKVQWKSGEEDYGDSRQAVITGGDTASHTITGLAAGTEHAVRVIATKEHADDGTPSAEVTGTPRASPPAEVTGVEVTSGVVQLEVSWTAVEDAGGYKVQWKSGTEEYDETRQAVVTGGDLVNYTITELTVGATYAVRVIASKEQADEGVPSAEVAGIPKASSPAQVTGVLVEAGAEALEVSWMAVSDAGGYKVQWKSGEEDYGDSRQAVITGGDTASHTITGLAAGTEHAVRVIATKEHADDGTPSAEVTGTPRASPPAEVTGVEVTSGVVQLEVSWTAVEDAGGYKVQWKSGTEEYDETRQAVVTGGDLVNYTITELTVGATYAVRVIASKEQADEGVPSAEVAGIPKASSPAQVTGVLVEAGAEALEVSWMAVSDAGGYKVQWKSGEEDYGDSRQAVITGGDTASHTITGLAAGTEHAVRVIATKEHADDGTPSAEVTGTPRASPPAEVTGVEVTSGVVQLEVSWTAVEDAGGYKVQWKSGTQDYGETRQATLTDGNTVRHTITQLNAGTEYTIQVLATKAYGDDGAPSSEATGTPKAEPPAQVTGVEITAGVEELEVSWTAVSDAGGYKVQWKSGADDYDDSRQAVIASSDTVNYTITDLTADTEYTVRVVATKDNADNGAPSAEVTGTPTSADPDVNGDGVLNGDDALAIYHSYASAAQLGDGETGGTPESRQSLLAGYSGKTNPSDDDLKEMIRKANTWKDAGVDAGGDINEDGVIDESDAFVMYYAYATENLVGNGETGGTARFRQLLLAAFANKDNPTDEDLKAMLRRANELREDFG